MTIVEQNPILYLMETNIWSNDGITTVSLVAINGNYEVRVTERLHSGSWLSHTPKTGFANQNRAKFAFRMTVREMIVRTGGREVVR